MRLYGQVHSLIFFCCCLLCFPVFAFAASGELQSIKQTVDAGEFQQAIQNLRNLRNQRFPGLTVEGETCSNQPEFILLLAAERSLARNDAKTSDNFLTQLTCLQSIDDNNVDLLYPPGLYQEDQGFKPFKPPECPNLVWAGPVNIKAAGKLFKQDNLHQAEKKLGQAICLLGNDHQQVKELLSQVSKPASSAGKSNSVVAIDYITAAPEPMIAQPEFVPEPQRETGLRGLIKEQQTPGQVAHNIPTTMQLGKSVDIEVRIQQQKLDTSTMIPGSGIQIHAIATVETMSVDLCCGEPAGDFPFDIKPLSVKQQPVTDAEFTQWVFDVTPRIAGAHRLKLGIHGVYKLPSGKTMDKSFPIELIPVDVEVIGGSKRWLIYAATGIAVFAMLIYWFSRQKKQRADVFISYRRDDSGGWSQSLHQQLSAQLEQGEIFMDLHDIPPGVDFPQFLQETLSKTRVVLVVIGNQWLSVTNARGQQRIFEMDDWVRQEIQFALDSGKKIVPVLVDGAKMPAASDLPPDIQKLSRLNGVNLHPDFFNEGVKKLADSIQHPLRSSVLRQNQS